MEKYHITDKGEVKTCTAHVRKCPINDAPMHFSNKEDAYEHIANTVNNSATLTKKNESMISQRDKKKKIQAFVELNKILEKSSRGFGYHVSNDGLEEINPDTRTDGTDFTYLGGGMVRDAYYHQKTNLVYKVNRFFTDEESRRFALHPLWRGCSILQGGEESPLLWTILRCNISSQHIKSSATRRTHKVRSRPKIIPP